MDLYIIQDSNGKYFRGKYGEEWVDSLKKARIYTSLQNVKTQINSQIKRFPDKISPRVLVVDISIVRIVDNCNCIENEMKSKMENIKQIKKDLIKLEKEYAASLRLSMNDLIRLLGSE